MKRLIHTWLMAAAMVCVAGCGKKAPAPANPDTARQALTEALDTWVQGGSADALAKLTPPIYFNDPQWKAGKRLKHYQIKGGLEEFGRQLRCTVSLALEDEEGKTEERDVPYQIDTHEVIVIARDF
jgi:predicted small lipoprotein YifL